MAEETEITKALALAERAHNGQLYNTQPYIEHPKRVALRLYRETEKIVALLHDVVEDTPVTLDEIRLAFGDVVADAVKALTRTPEESYFGYIMRVRENELARRVKIADLQENIEQSYSPLAPKNSKTLRGRYLKALPVLGYFYGTETNNPDPAVPD